LLSHNELYSENVARIDRLRRYDIKREIEAALFSARRILSIKDIKNIFPKIHKKEILILIRELIEEYRTFKTSLEIIEFSDSRFELKLKDSIVNSIEKFTQGDLLEKNDIKTLAIIAYLYPSATRKKLRQKLNNSSTMYTSLKNLKKLHFIIEKEQKISLTQYFYDYFQIKNRDCEIF